MDARFKKSVSTKIDYGDFDDWVHEKYPAANKFQVACCLESPNDTSHKIHVDGGKRNEWEDKDWQDFLTWGKEFWSLPRLILDQAVADGELEAGTYYIEVSW